MLQTRRWVKFLVRETKPKLLDQSARRPICRVMSCEESFDAKSFESEGDHGSSSFLSQALAPVLGSQMNPLLENLLLIPVGSQSGAAGKLAILQQEDGPVLNSVDRHQFDLSTEPHPHFIRRERTIKEDTLGSHQRCMANGKSVSRQWLNPRRSVFTK
jgi:hypothetical protein